MLSAWMEQSAMCRIDTPACPSTEWRFIFPGTRSGYSNSSEAKGRVLWPHMKVEDDLPCPRLAFKMWWLAVLNWDINQMWHSELAHDSGSVACDGAGYIFKEPFFLLFRATLRKLRPEDMFETWVSTREDEALRPLLPNRNKPPLATKLLLPSPSLWLSKQSHTSPEA